MALLRRTSRFAVSTPNVFSHSLLTFCGTFRIQLSWIAICAEVNVWNFLAMIITNDVLPGVAFLTVDRIAVIVTVGTNAFDGVIFGVILHYRIGEAAI